MKKLFLLFCFLQITSLAFCKHVIFDLPRNLITDRGFLSREIEKVVKNNADLVADDICGQAFGFNSKDYPKELIREYNAKLNHLRLFYACSKKSQDINRIDFIREFYTGKIKAEEIFKFIQEYKNDIYSMVCEEYNVFLGALDRKALDLVAEMFLSKNMVGHCYANQLSYFDFFKENIKAKHLLRHLKEAGNKIYSVSNFPKEWYEAYKLKFSDLFSYFGESNMLFSFQVGCVKPEEEVFKVFLSKYNLKAKDCILIDSNQETLDAAMYLGFKTILFDSQNPKSVIDALKSEGALKREQTYFIPEWE